MTLADCITKALQVYPSMAVAHAQADIAQAQDRETAAALLPNMHTEINYLQEPGYRQVITNRGLSSWQFITDYTVYDGGRRRARLHAADYYAQAAKLGIAAARNLLIRDTTIAYYSLLQASRDEQVLASGEQRLESYLGVIHKLRTVGRATASDELRIIAQADDNRLQLLSARQHKGEASLDLATFIGADGKEDLTVVEQPRPSLADAGTTAANPVLQALEGQQKAAEAEVAAARGERLPTFGLAVTYGFLGTDPPSTISKYGGASYGGTISMPVFDGGAIKARIEQADAHLKQIAAQTAQTRIELEHALHDAWLRYRQARDATALLQSAIPTAEDSFNLSWARFLGNGTITLLEVIDSYRHLLTIKLSLSEQEFAAAAAAAQIAELRGNGVQ